jgi:hypothetical protein
VLIGSEKAFAGTDVSGAVEGTIPPITLSIPGTDWHPAEIVPLGEVHGAVVSLAFVVAFILALIVASAASQVPSVPAKAMTSAMSKRHKVDILFSVNSGFIFNGNEAEKNCEILRLDVTPHRRLLGHAVDLAGRAPIVAAERREIAPDLPTVPVEEMTVMGVPDVEPVPVLPLNTCRSISRVLVDTATIVPKYWITPP